MNTNRRTGPLMQLPGPVTQERVPHLQAVDISKNFGGSRALQNIDLSVERDSFHALVGENGAGKSTLGRIFAGLHRPSSGELRVDGEPVRLRGPGDALMRGVTMVVQERTIVPRMSVLDNVLLNREVSRASIVDQSRNLARYDEVCELAGFRLDPRVKVGSLRPAEQLRVEILRALARDVKVLVLDEVTAALTPNEAQAFFALLKQLRHGGRTIVYVTHFLAEVTEFADTVSILRDGELVRTADASSETPSTLISGMLGRTLESVYPVKLEAPAPTVQPVFRVQNLTRGRTVNSVNLEIRPGEIVGLAGLVGSGRTEIARAIFGADRRDSGVIELDGKVIRHRTPGQAIRHGLAMIPESRQHDGLMLNRSIGENLTLAHQRLIGSAGFVNSSRESRVVRNLIQRFNIRTRSPKLSVSALSGGNQQKVLFAKWLVGQPKVLLADEPTRGVDVGAKRAIYDLLNDLAKQGTAVLLISSELDEILSLSHRVLVVKDGAIVSQFESDMNAREAILRAAFGSDSDEALDQIEVQK